MIARLRPRLPSHTTLAAYLALFVVLGGTAYAAAMIGASDIKDNAVRSRHIKNGQVTRNDLADATLAPGAVSRVQDNPLDGGPDITAPDPCNDGQVNVFCGYYTAVGDTRYRGWRNYPGEEWADAGYWSDAGGLVHLTGLLRATAANRPDRLFILPPDYRPATNEIFTASCSEVESSEYIGACIVYVYADGSVTWRFGTRPTPFISLDGISFRTD